jgi:hypothetical protein
MSLAPTERVQKTSKPTDLVFLRDLKDAFSIVKKTLQKNIGFFYVLAGIALADFLGQAANFPIPFLDWCIELATLFVASSVIVLAYKELKPDFDEGTVQEKSEKRIISASVWFSLGTFFFSMFFVLPAIWFAVKSCLATVIACLENCSGSASIKRSHELVKGNFMTAFGYAVFKPSLVWLALMAVDLTFQFACKLLGPEVGKIPLAAISGAGLFVNSMFQLTIFVLLVHLYFNLKHLDRGVVSPAVTGVAVPYTAAPISMPAPLPEIDDSKLNPRW